MKLYILKNDTDQKTKALLVPFRSGSRFMEKIAKAYPDAFSHNIDLTKARDVDDSLCRYADVAFVNKVAPRHWAGLEVYIPMRDPFDQYCSCLDLVSIGQLTEEDRVETDRYSYGFGKMFTQLETKIHYNNTSDDCLWHFENNNHNRPTSFIPMNLTLCGITVRTLDMKTNELTAFVNENIGKVTADHHNSVSAYAQRSAPSAVGEKLFNRLRKTYPQVGLWLQFYTDIYNNFVKGMNHRKPSDNVSEAMKIFYQLTADPLFAMLCSHELDILKGMQKTFIPSIQNNVGVRIESVE